MGSFYSFGEFVPVVDETAFVHPNATIIGNVVIGRDVYIGPAAVIRGDWGGVEIADGCNVQETCVIHAFPGVTAVLEEAAHIGHGAILHGAQIGRNVLVGMNAVVMDRATIGAESIVGALTFVPADMQVPARSVVVGNPARIVKQVSDEMLSWKSEGTALYQRLPQELRAQLTECEPLRERPTQRPQQAPGYQTWHEVRSRGAGMTRPSLERPKEST